VNSLRKAKTARTRLRLAATGLIAAGAGVLLTANTVAATPPPTVGPVYQLTAPGTGGLLNGVSCTDATDCTAVGGDDDGQATYATETDRVWGPVTEISAPGGGGFFDAVSCTDATDCSSGPW
jgi:hypothetical protein